MFARALSSLSRRTALAVACACLAACSSSSSDGDETPDSGVRDGARDAATDGGSPDVPVHRDGGDGGDGGPDGDGGAPPTPICVEGTSRCDGAQRLSCAPGGLTETSEACADGCRAVDETHAECRPFCEQDARQCNGAVLERCNDTGTAFAPLETCTKGCADGRCRTCADGESRCANDVREQCDTSGAAFETAETCELGCDGTLCRGAVCDPAIRMCDGAKLLECEPRTGYRERGTCSFGCASGACRNCSPGQTSCDGDRQVRCNDTGSNFVAVGTCPFGCNTNNGECKPPVCDEGETRCNAGKVETCSPGRIRFDVTRTCVVECREAPPEAARCVDPAVDFCGTAPMQAERCLATVPGLQLDYGPVFVGQTLDAEVSIKSVGEATLTVTALGVAPLNSTFAIVDMPAVPFTIPASDARLLTVRFTPLQIGDRTAAVTLETNDPITPRRQIGLFGNGRDPQQPSLDVGTDDRTIRDPDFGTNFVALTEGGTLTYYCGFQGSGDVFLGLRAHGVNPTEGRVRATVTRCPADDGLACDRATDPQWGSLGGGQTVNLDSLGNNDYETVGIDLTITGEMRLEMLNNARVVLYMSYTNADSSVSVQDQVTVRLRTATCPFR